jgi:hypothetical protein
MGAKKEMKMSCAWLHHLFVEKFLQAALIEIIDHLINTTVPHPKQKLRLSQAIESKHGPIICNDVCQGGGDWACLI